MKQQYAQEWPQFFTATIQDWKLLLKEDKYKNIIIDALKFLVAEEKVTINGFVIMTNHLHIILLTADRFGNQKATTAYKKYKIVLLNILQKSLKNNWKKTIT
jgi:putative transposase